VAAGSTLDELGVQGGDRILLQEGSAPRSGGGLNPVIISTFIGILTAILVSSFRY